MKIPDLLHIRESLASRIILWVVLYVVIILTISGYVGDYFVRKFIWEVQENGIMHAIAARRLSLALTMVSLISLIVLTGQLRRLIHKLIDPLTAFTQVADEVAKGNLQATLPEIKSRDEMQQLRHSFSIMQQSLSEQMEELKQVNAAKGRIEGELQAACNIQQSMLPKAYLPDAYSHCLDICGQLISAKDVGGDLYDFFVSNGKLFFCIGDVSGKGVPAALVMAMTLSQFRNVARYEGNIRQIIQSLNATRCEGNDTLMFVTFFAGVLDLETGLLQYCNAGHNKPFIMNGSISELPAKPDLPLGVSDDAVYAVREYTLQSDSTLFLYTDGLTEAMTARREQFGRERLQNTLRKGAGCREQIEEMTLAVRQFVGDAPQSDDLTMLAIHWKNE
ncbi:MAG: SpoIIE family protein phosphatase [Bacteroidaceae bacterium]|nr:SpoIIE family protein phosphatase [Bacteroidaceae bacterium]